MLVVVGDIFGGLSDLDVAAVGHVTAITVAAAVGSLLVWQLRRRQRGPLGVDPSGTGPGSVAGDAAHVYRPPGQQE